MPTSPAAPQGAGAAGPVAEPFPRLHAPSAQERLVDAGRCLRPDGALERYSVHQDAEGRHWVRVAVTPGEGAVAAGGSASPSAPGAGSMEAGGAEPGPAGAWADPIAGALPAPSLWHLVLAPEGRPERMEARWSVAGTAVELALTFFPDEVLIWRRGAGPAAESLALPPGYRLLWPPVSGREACLTSLDELLDASGRGLLMVCALACRPAARGGLRARPVKLDLYLGAGEADSGSAGSPATSPDASAASSDSGAVAPEAAPETQLTLSTPGWPAQRLTLDPAGRLASWQVDETLVACQRPWNP